MKRARLLFTAAAMASAGCAHSPPTTLHALVSAPPATTAPAYAGLAVQVGAVRLPPGLDRLELLRELGPGRYVVEEFDRWAAPPSRLVRQALAEDLALRLPGSGGPASSGAPTTVISVDVLAFTAAPPTAALSATWTRSCRPGEAQERSSVQLQVPSSRGAPEALSLLTGILADRIAADLASRPDLACVASPGARR